MTALSGPLHLFALVLIVSGVQKVLAPEAATTAMRSAGIPTWPTANTAGRLLGAVEAGVGLAALALPAPASALALGAVYLLLGAFVLRLRSRDAEAGCGCFGSSSAPPTRSHIALDAVGASVGMTAAVVGVPDIVDVFDHGIGAGVPYLALLVVGSVLALLGPALFGELAQLRRGGAAPRSFALTPGGDAS